MLTNSTCESLHTTVHESLPILPNSRLTASAFVEGSLDSLTVGYLPGIETPRQCKKFS